MNARLHPILRPRTAFAFLTMASVPALGDTLTTAVDVRTLGGGGANTNYSTNQHLSLYSNGTNVQRTWLNFDLSAYAGQTLTSDVTLTLIADASAAGGLLSGASIGEAQAAWTFAGITFNNSPATTAITGAVNPSGTFATDAAVTWTIPAYVVQKWIDDGYFGIGLTSAAGSQLHFKSSRWVPAAAPALSFAGAISNAAGAWTSAVDGAWTTDGNWSGNVHARGIDQAATFTGSTGVTVTLDADRTVGSLAFDNASFTISGTRVLTLNQSAGTPSIHVGTTGGTWTAAISTPISGADGLTKTGGGLLVLSGANLHAGVTTVSAGTLRVQNNAALGSAAAGTVVNDGATLDLGGTMAAGALNLGTEVVTVTGSGVGGGGVIVNNGSNGQENALQRLVLAGPATAGGSARWDVRGGGNTFDMGGFTLTKTGGNLVSLVGTTISNPGNIDVQTGSFGLHTAFNLPGGAANTMTVRAGATLDLYANNGTKPWTLVLDGGQVTTSSGMNNTWNGPATLSGTGGTFNIPAGQGITLSGPVGESTSGRELVKTGDGLLVLGATGGYSGVTRVNQGSLQVTTGSALGSGGLVLNGGTLVGGVFDLPNPIAVNNVPNNRIYTNSANLTLSGAWSGNGAVGFNGSTTPSSVIVSGDTSGFSGTINFDGQNSRNNLFLAGAGANLQNATLNFTNSAPGNNYGFGWNGVGNGTIQLGALSGTTGNIYNNVSGTTMTLQIGALGTTTNYGGSISNVAGTTEVTKVGAGALTLSGAFGYSGPTAVNDGILILQGGGNAYNGGNLLINGPSTLRIAGTRLDFNGKTFTFDAAGGGVIDAQATGAGGFVFMGSNTFATSGGAQNRMTGTKGGADNLGFNLNGNTAVFSVAPGTDATSDLKVAGTLWNNGGVTKTGAGRLELSGDNIYTGPTEVQDGTLLVNGSHTGGGLISVSSAATLGGGGRVGPVDFWTAGTLSPGSGDPARTDNWLEVGALSLGDAATRLNFELGVPDDGGTPWAANDLVIAADLPYLRGVLNVTPLAGFASAPAGSKWRLFGLSAGTLATANEITLVDGVSSGYAIEAVTGDTAVYLVAVPEAGAAGLVVLGAVFLRALRRR